ncbi:MAG: hypothetical protein V7K77_13765 [Nostoc sp.]|uniref:hypothetical protein n=1 Tax=Nostoc sp. TaxID=1180 RepID=UPI002FF57BD9
MPNNYGIILCDADNKDRANSYGRNNLINATTQTWQRKILKRDGTEENSSVKALLPCDGLFTGHILVLMHGNYAVGNDQGYLYLKDENGLGDPETGRVIGTINALQVGVAGAMKRIYIYACGQGATAVLAWYRGPNGFNIPNVWCPCTTAALGGAIDFNDIKTKLDI